MTARKTHPVSDMRVLFTSDWAHMSRQPLTNTWVVGVGPQNPHERWIATYANLVGKRNLFGRISATSIHVVIEGINGGLPTGTIDKVTNLMGVNRRELSHVLDISPSALSRGNTLKASVSERVFRISALFQKTLEVVGDKQEARHWFTTPKKALGGKTPFEYASTEVGAREVEDLLGRIEYGVYA